MAVIGQYRHKDSSPLSTLTFFGIYRRPLITSPQPRREIESVQIVEIQKADDSHPRPRHAVRVLSVEVESQFSDLQQIRVDLFSLLCRSRGGNRGRDERPRSRADEGLVPDHGEAAVGSFRELFQVVAQYNHDGLDLLPIHSLRAIIPERPPQRGVGVLPQIINFRAGESVGLSGSRPESGA